MPGVSSPKQELGLETEESPAVVSDAPTAPGEQPAMVSDAPMVPGEPPAVVSDAPTVPGEPQETLDKDRLADFHARGAPPEWCAKYLEMPVQMAQSVLVDMYNVMKVGKHPADDIAHMTRPGRGAGTTDSEHFEDVTRHVWVLRLFYLFRIPCVRECAVWHALCTSENLMDAGTYTTLDLEEAQQCA